MLRRLKSYRLLGYEHLAERAGRCSPLVQLDLVEREGSTELKFAPRSRRTPTGCGANAHAADVSLATVAELARANTRGLAERVAYVRMIEAAQSLRARAAAQAIAY